MGFTPGICRLEGAGGGENEGSKLSGAPAGIGELGRSPVAGPPRWAGGGAEPSTAAFVVGEGAGPGAVIGVPQEGQGAVSPARSAETSKWMPQEWQENRRKPLVVAFMRC